MLAKLYYGNGEVTIEGSEIKGVQIKYNGSIKVEKTAGDNFVMVHNHNGIIFFPLGEGYLSELFNYGGTLKITSLIVADKNGNSMPSSIKRVMDYSELIDSTAETMTNKVEELSVGYGSTNKKIIETPQMIENLNTADKSTPFYLLNGEEYTGYYHIHLTDAACMTGRVHDDNSQLLYFRQIKDGKILNNLIPTKNPSNIPPAATLSRKKTRWGIKEHREITNKRLGRK